MRGEMSSRCLAEGLPGFGASGFRASGLEFRVWDFGGFRGFRALGFMS